MAAKNGPVGPKFTPVSQEIWTLGNLEAASKFPRKSGRSLLNFLGYYFGVWVIHRPDQTMAFSGRSSNKHRATDRLTLQNNIEILGFPTAKERQCTYLLHLGDKIIKMSESQISSFQIESVFLTE